MHHRMMKHALLWLLVLTLVWGSSSMVFAGTYGMDSRQTGGAAMAADVVIARPLGIVATATGFGLFLISSPFALLGGNTGESWKALVVAPIRYTFARPLGDFSENSY